MRFQRLSSRRRQIRGSLPGLVLGGGLAAGLLLVASSQAAAVPTPAPAHLTWSTAAAGLSPPALKYASAAYDSANDTVVLFGGVEPNGTLSADTWVWNGVWTDFPGSAIPSPPARQMASMAFDPTLNQMILFGGAGATSQVLGDTWAWSGSSWYELIPNGASPTPRQGAALAYDGFGRLVLFGGTTAPSASIQPTTTTPTTVPVDTTTPSVPVPTTTVAPASSTTGTVLGDTWLWTATGWAPSSASGPPARSGASLAYDSSSHSLVMFGGTTAASGAQVQGLLSDTWTWTGTDWTQAHPKASPPGRVYAAFADDPPAKAAVLLGGAGSAGPFGDTWMWNGTDWLQAAAPDPGARSGQAAALDAYSQQVLLFGGVDGSGQVLGVTTLLTTTNPSAPSGPGRADRAATSGHVGLPGSAESLKAPSTTLPSAGPPKPLAAGATVLHRGQTVALSGSGFAPRTLVTISFHSTPQTLGYVIADKNGRFHIVVNVPMGAPTGSHRFVAQGRNPDNKEAELEAAVQVVAPGIGGGKSHLLQTEVMVGLAVLLPIGAWFGMAGGTWLRRRRRVVVDRGA